MKKILIVNKSFETGGIQSSMINMANELSKDYEVHLFIYNPVGVMKERLNDKVKILNASWRFNCLGMSIKDAVKTKKIKMIAFRLFATAWSKLFNNELPLNMAIKHQAKMKDYDLAIAYHQEQRKKSVVSGFVRVVDRCVESKKKAAWLHFDSNTIDLDSHYNNRFYKKMDKLICVSRSLMENFSSTHKELSDKMDYCYNFMLYDVMKEKSLAYQEVSYPSDKFICFSACRLTKEKALTRSIKAMASAFKKHSDVMWFIAGDGPEKDNIESAIKENDLCDQIILLGNQSNPYPYMKNADLLINVSYHEAAPMVFFESKALGIPVFATKTSSSEELLNNGKDSFICENAEEGIKDSFAALLDNRELVSSAKERLTKYCANNSESLKKIKSLMDLD